MKVLITLASVLILSANATAENDMAFYSMEADTCFMQTETCVDVPICDIALCEQEETKILQPQKATAKKAQKAKEKRNDNTTV